MTKTFRILLVLVLYISSISCNEDPSNGDQTTLDSDVVPTNLYEDISESLNVAMHTYGFACLQSLVKGSPKDFEQDPNVSILEKNMSPMDSSILVSFARNNKETLKKMNETGKEISLESSVSFHHLWDSKQSGWEEGRFTIAIDTEEEEKELVYGIVVDNLRRRIIVSFRGSESIEDWTRNIGGINLKKVDNPHYQSDDNQPKEISIHTGFHDYLLKKRWFSGKRLPKYEMIKDQLLSSISRYPDYSLYVTGHSLGGALSSIFAFFIASETDIQINHPVTLISFASPLVGDKMWQKAFQLVEEYKKMRHVRVTVLEDFVPTVPQRAPFNPFQWFMRYQHTGMNLRLNNNGTYDIVDSYNMKNTGVIEGVTDWIWNVLDHHSLGMYDKRLDMVSNKLTEKQMTDLSTGANEAKTPDTEL